MSYKCFGGMKQLIFSYQEGFKLISLFEFHLANSRGICRSLPVFNFSILLSISYDQTPLDFFTE